MDEDEALSALGSDDPLEVKQAALCLGRTRDAAYVGALIAARDRSFQDYQRRPQPISGERSAFGYYRDKVGALIEALWMIGTPQAMEWARYALDFQVWEAGQTGQCRAEMSVENYLMGQFESGRPYHRDWRKCFDYGDSWTAAMHPELGISVQSLMIAEGWHLDPLGRHELRYFDGTGWTPHVSDVGVVTQDAHRLETMWT